MIKLPIQERRLVGLKIAFIGGLIAIVGFGLSFLIESVGWILMVLGFITALAGGAVHAFMVFAHMGAIIKKSRNQGQTTDRRRNR